REVGGWLDDGDAEQLAVLEALVPADQQAGGEDAALAGGEDVGAGGDEGVLAEELQAQVGSQVKAAAFAGDDALLEGAVDASRDAAGLVGEQDDLGQIRGELARLADQAR